MADEGLTTMLRRLEPPQPPSQAFADELYATLRPLALDAGRRDATVLGRLTALWPQRRSIGRPATVGWPARIALASLIVLLLIAVLAVLAGRRPSGPFIHFTGTGIYRISTNGDVATSSFIASSVAAVSPDGRYAVISSTDSIPTTAPAIIDTITGGSQALTTAAGRMTASWSSTDQLAWAIAPIGTDGSCCGDPTGIELIHPGDPAARRWSVPDGSHIGEIAWSPNGRRLAISTVGLCDGATSSSTYLLDATTLEATRTAISQSGSSVRWAPDDRTLLMLAANDCDATGRWRLLSADAGTGHASVVIDAFTGSAPVWTPGGGWLDISIGDDSDDGRIWQMRPDGSDRRVIARLPHPPDQFVPSPDGASILATVHSDGLPADANYGGWSTAWVFGVDGADAHPVVDGIWSAWPPAWSPDGRWIIVTRAPAGPSEERSSIKAARTVWMVHPDGTDLQQIVRPGGAVGF